MKMTLNNRDWLRCKRALESAVRVDAARSDAWLEANEQYATQTLSHGWHPAIGAIRLTDLIEKHIGLFSDSRLPDPPNDTAHYKHWLRMNCFRLSERLSALGDDTNTFSWLRREYLRAHGRLVK